MVPKRRAAGALHHVSYGVVSLSPATAARIGMDTSEGRLADWPDTLEMAAVELDPTLVTTYAYELAQRFTDFYENIPVLKAPEHERPFRIWLVALSRAVLADALGVLGLPAPERM